MIPRHFRSALKEHERMAAGRRLMRLVCREAAAVQQVDCPGSPNVLKPLWPEHERNALLAGGTFFFPIPQLEIPLARFLDRKNWKWSLIEVGTPYLHRASI